jgi:2'-5' RNA ligase
MSQFSLFGVEAAPTDGFFLALFPEAHARARIGDAVQGQRSRHRLIGKPLAAERLHISLVGLGEYHGVPCNLVPAATSAAAGIELPAFDVGFDRIVSFSGGRRRPLVLAGGDGVARLIAFQRTVAVAMHKAGLGRTRQQFTPHVTLLYDERGIEEQPIERIGWTVTEFVLVHSLLGRSQYNILGRWPLRADSGRLN